MTKKKPNANCTKVFLGEKMTHFEGEKNHMLLYLDNKFFLVIGTREDFIKYIYII